MDFGDSGVGNVWKEVIKDYILGTGYTAQVTDALKSQKSPLDVNHVTKIYLYPQTY